MKLPRDISGEELGRRLGRYAYRAVRQTGSHIRLTSSIKGVQHHVTIPAHHSLRVGTLSAVLRDIADYLEIDREQLAKELFD